MDDGNQMDSEFEGDLLHFAVQNGDMHLAGRLLDEGHPINAFDELAKTPLHYAARNWDRQMMEFLIEAGADVNAHDPDRIGETPLGEIAGNCPYEVALILVKAGADPTIEGWMRNSALSRAKDRKRPEGLRVKELLEEAARNPSRLRGTRRRR